MRIKKLIVFLIFSAVSIFLFSCLNSEPGSDSNGYRSGSAKVRIKLEKVGALAKANKTTDIAMNNLYIQFTADEEASIFDTLVLSGNDQINESKTYFDLASRVEWTLTTQARDSQDSIIHSGSTVFTIQPGQTEEVSLELHALYSMLKANFFPIRDSVTRCELLIGSMVKRDSSFIKQSMIGDTVTLKYDYLPASPSGVTNSIQMDVYGDMWGANTLLYSGDTTIDVYSGADETISLVLRWVGPETSPPGQAAMTAMLGTIGTITINAELEDITEHPMSFQGMARIPAKDSSFLMGMENYAMPIHEVMFTRDFWMDTTEITQKQYMELMEVTYGNFVVPPWQDIYGKGDNYPANNLNWFDAALYCNARTKASGSSDTVYQYTSIEGSPGDGCILHGLIVDLSKNGFHLPTEAQWEYAVRAGTTTAYFWGDSLLIDHYAWYNSNSGVSGRPVAQKLPNLFNLYDMIGNVSEWCNDWHWRYPDSSLADPTGPDTTPSSIRVLRGGSWGSPSGEVLQSSYRMSMPPRVRIPVSGFRTSFTIR